MSFWRHEMVRGWAVLRRDPWDFKGIYPGRHEAEEKVEELGAEYEVQFGEAPEASDDFTWLVSE